MCDDAADNHGGAPQSAVIGQGGFRRHPSDMRRCLAALFPPLPAPAAEVDLELVLPADASGSIDEAEIRLQREGQAEAIPHPDVIGTVRSTMTGTTAVTSVTSAANQAVVVDWTVIDSEPVAGVSARRLRVAPRQAFGRDAIGRPCKRESA